MISLLLLLQAARHDGKSIPGEILLPYGHVRFLFAPILVVLFKMVHSNRPLLLSNLFPSKVLT